VAEPAVPRVLIVDDDPTIRQMLHELLDDCGLEVVGQAGDGLEGLDLVSGLLPDIVVMDARMPGLSGIDATRRLSATMPSVRVVLLTAFDDPTLRLQAAQAGAFATVVKGNHPSRLMRAVRDAWISMGLLDGKPDAAGG
jgi:DNA-binding NarL/FixJ family response regulator